MIGSAIVRKKGIELPETNLTGEKSPARIVVLLSGGGRTLRNLLAWIEAGDLNVSVARVISTRGDAAGNRIATGSWIPLTIVARRGFESTEAFSSAVIELLDAEQPDLVVCAGFLTKLEVPDRYLGSIVNIHPSLLPLFGGKGYYGDRVHRAVLQSGMKVSGCTVHFVDNQYDAGPIIAQRCVPVEPEDTVESLAARVFEAECDLYPRIVQGVLDGRVRLENGRVAFAGEATD